MRSTGKNRKKRIEQDKEQRTNSVKLERASRDITMHEKMEKPEYDTQTRYRALFENANDAIFLMEVDKFVECNPKTCEMFGCSPEQIIGKTPYDPYSPEFQPDGRKSKEKTLEKIHLAMQGQPQLFNWRHNKYNGKVFDAEVSLNRLELSGTVFIQAIVRNITERKQLEDKLKNSEDKYQTLVEHVNEIIFMHDSDFILTYISPQCEKITGYTAQELVGQRWDSYATDNPINKLALDIFEEVRETGKSPKTHQVEIRGKDGDVIILEVNDRILRNANGDVMGIVGSARNITNQKLMEQALAESEQKFRTFFENEPEYCYMISPQGTILEANSTALSVLGYAKEELIGKPIESLYAPELYERGRQLLSQWKQTGEIRNEEMVIITRNGDRRTVLLSSAQVLGENGKSLHSISIQRDITESKKAQEELKKSKEFLDNVINSLDDSFFIKDQEHRWLMLNDAACELIGRPREELIGKSDYDIFPKEQANVFWEKDSLVFETGRTNVNEEHVTWHDRVHTISSKKSLYTDPVTGQKFITGINRDITERKRLEEAHRSLVDNSLQGLAIVQDGRMVFINKAFTSTTGYSREDLLAASPEQLQSMVHPDDRELIWLRHRDRIAGKPVPARYEFRWIRKDGSTCWVEIYASRIEYQGRPAIQTAYIDITERKQAEEALFKEKKFTEDAINAQMDTFFVFETGTGKAIRWNKAFTDISGYTDEEIAGLPAPASYYSSEDLERAAAFIQNVLKEGVGTIELELICKDGRKVPTEYRVSLINDDQGEPKYFISIGRDITECKRAEEAMKKSSVIIDSTADAVITSDITGNITFWNKGAEIIYGYQKEEAVGKPVSILYKEENLHVLEAMIADLLEGKDIPGIEATCINKKQQDVEILLSLTSIRDADGNVTEFVGITKDITERKRMEERVAKSRELFSKIFYANPIPATITTVSNDKLLMVNDAWLKLMGFDSQEEAIGKSAVDLGLWADIEDREERNINLQQEGSSDIQEMRVHTPSGRIRDCLYTAEMIEYESQPHILSTAIDITERKKAQQKLLEYQRQLKSLASELLLAEERERRRIATGVHDDIGQKLALAKLELQSMNEIVTEPDVSASLGHACELVDKAMQDARSLAFDLSNPVLYEVGFAAAVESLLTERMMQKSGIKFEFKSKTRKLKLGQDMSIVLFQAVRELLTNVVKHANANKVKVCIDKSDNRVHVIVEDDGAGFELPKLQSPDRKKGGFGLFNVKERLEYLGGSFDIKSKPRQGTRVIMAVPLEPGIMTS